MFSVLLSGIVCFLSLFIAEATDCPDLWIAYSGSCYRFGHQAMTFFEGEHYCQQHQSHLIHIDGKDENDFLKEEISYFQVDKFWIGLTDDDIEGKWVWYGTNTAAEYTDWYPNQPDSSGNNEDCAEVVRHSPSEIHWNDLNCHTLRQPICEKGADDGNMIIG